MITNLIIQAAASTPPEQCENISELLTDGVLASSILTNIANKLDLTWFEWSVKLALAAVIILCFKEIIFSFYRYIILRLDKHMAIGTIIRFNHNVYGRVQEYNLRSIKIETKIGIVKIPLETWLSNYYVHVRQYDVNINELEDSQDPIIKELIYDRQKHEKDLKAAFDAIHDLKRTINDIAKENKKYNNNNEIDQNRNQNISNNSNNSNN